MFYDFPWIRANSLQALFQILSETWSILPFPFDWSPACGSYSGGGGLAISTLSVSGGWTYLLPGLTWRLTISTPWLCLGLTINIPWLYLEAGHIFSLAIPGGWPYLFPGYTWMLAISPLWLYLEAGHVSSWLYL